MPAEALILAAGESRSFEIKTSADDAQVFRMKRLMIVGDSAGKVQVSGPGMQITLKVTSDYLTIPLDAPVTSQLTLTNNTAGEVGAILVYERGAGA